MCNWLLFQLIVNWSNQSKDHRINRIFQRFVIDSMSVWLPLDYIWLLSDYIWLLLNCIWLVLNCIRFMKILHSPFCFFFLLLLNFSLNQKNWTFFRLKSYGIWLAVSKALFWSFGRYEAGIACNQREKILQNSVLRLF